jgi:hypothetical protein
MRTVFAISSLIAVLSATFPAPAGECPAVDQIKYMPVKDEFGLDRVFDRLRLDRTCEAVLLAAMTDTRPMPDPRYEPTRTNRFVVADAAFFVLWSKYEWKAEQFLPPEIAAKYNSEGVYAYFDYVADPAHRASLAARAKVLVDRESHTKLIHLRILPGGHAQFDNGPELDLEQLRTQVRLLKQKTPHPDISFKLDKTVKYADIAGVLAVFQEEEYGPHFGFVGLERPR